LGWVVGGGGGGAKKCTYKVDSFIEADQVVYIYHSSRHEELGAYIARKKHLNSQPNSRKSVYISKLRCELTFCEVLPD